MLTEVCGRDWGQSERASMLVAQIDALALKHGSMSGAIEFETFDEFVRRTPNLLQPAFQLQLQMREKLGGEAFWLKIEKRREALESIKNRDGTSSVGTFRPSDVISELRQQHTEQKTSRGAGEGLNTQRSAIAYLRRGSGGQVVPDLTPKHVRSADEAAAMREAHEYQKSRAANFDVHVHPMLLPKREVSAEERKRRPSSKFASRSTDYAVAAAPSTDEDDGLENDYLLARREAKLDANAVFDDMRMNMGTMKALNPSEEVTHGILSRRGGEFLMDDSLNSCDRKIGHREEMQRVHDELAAVLEWQQEMIRSQRVSRARIRDARSGRDIDWCERVGHVVAPFRCFYPTAFVCPSRQG